MKAPADVTPPIPARGGELTHHPYRAGPRDEPLPDLPLRGVRAEVAALVVAVALLGTGAVVLLRSPPPATAPVATFEVAQLFAWFKDDTAAARWRNQTVIVRGVVRELRRDSFGHVYVELGRGVGYEVPVMQCFVADASAKTPAPGTVARFRARLLGMSLGVALQADECTALEGAM